MTMDRDEFDLLGEAVALTAEVRILSNALKESEEKRGRQNVKQWLVILLLSIGLMGTAINARNINMEAKARSLENCELQNDTRQLIKETFGSYNQILIAAAQTDSPDSRTQLQVEEFLKQYEMAINSKVTPIDCAKRLSSN